MSSPKNKFFLAFLLFIMAGLGRCLAQDSDHNYRENLAASLTKIEEIFGVQLKYEPKLVEGKSLDYAYWRIRQGNLEVSLTAVLAPFDLTFFKEDASHYTIKPFQYHKKSRSAAEEQLDFLASTYHNLEEWENRKALLKACIMEALALEALPAAPNNAPIVNERKIFEGYSVENIALEVLPGIFTTGSIYRPFPLGENLPIVIMPNGHFGQGRYRESQQIRSATLARMGAVVVGYDLFAWGESLLQFDSEDHHLAAAHSLQTWNGIQWIDYLTALPETDPQRVGITGGSGGGSQTMLLSAIDDRITVSVPTVMLSSHFSGGCPCESGKPIHLCGGGTNNAEIAAMTAPRPLLIISDGGDWTHSVPELELPYIRRIYGFYDQEDLLINSHFSQEGHDYGFSKRQAMYPFMAKHLGLNPQSLLNQLGQVAEDNITILSEQDLQVFGADGSLLPAHAVQGREALFELLEGN
ncbi:dienelactone hydrolase family protein [Echinicola pacifica]|uniref:acetylxylan esterase n=1 Tax=Echinicola pacifica TaxID=346377 RepID=UPI00035D2459|nr:acetylxylan esterase [Echinicola pacifica]